ncbi:hypothetical protein [Clostridium tarantellae]|nr:hypothetical protein [Clostridium tarantellae]
MLKLRDLEEELVELKLKKRNLILTNKSTDEINKLIEHVENEINNLKNNE